jgi:hypothetical protein
MPMSGELIFEKRRDKYDAMFVVRDGRLEEVPCPKQAPIPHDMFHYAVERVLNVRGFAHRVAAGEAAGFRMAPEAESESVERLVEVMQADTWSGRPDPADAIALYDTTCQARGDSALPIGADDIVAIRAEVDRLAALWTATPVGCRLSLPLT